MLPIRCIHPAVEEHRREDRHEPRPVRRIDLGEHEVVRRHESPRPDEVLDGRSEHQLVEEHPHVGADQGPRHEGTAARLTESRRGITRSARSTTSGTVIAAAVPTREPRSRSAACSTAWAKSRGERTGWRFDLLDDVARAEPRLGRRSAGRHFDHRALGGWRRPSCCAISGVTSVTVTPGAPPGRRVGAAAARAAPARASRR